MRKGIILLLIFVFTLSLFAKESSRKYKTTKLNENITFDGKLDEKIYLEVKPITGFTQEQPNEGDPATEKTEVWFMYDADYIYISAMLYDSQPDKIEHSVFRRDYDPSSDWFTFTVDPYLDKMSGYFFAVNAGGSIKDGTISNDTRFDNSWNGVWDVKTEINSKGWSLEMKIPFHQLRFNPKEDMIWGFNFLRSIYRNNEKSYFVMVPKNESGFVSKFAEISGISKTTSNLRLEIMPYLLSKAQYLKHNEEDPFYKGNRYKFNAGVDFKLKIGNNFNLDATINPDFGQVEVDPAVLNLSASETYYSEKRPFFIEGADIFDNFGLVGARNNSFMHFASPKLFYSRRIGRSPQLWTTHKGFTDTPEEARILGAAKLTGKINNTWTVGALTAATERTYAEIDLEGKRLEEEVEPFTHYTVLRALRNFDEGNNGIGFMFTSVNRDLNTKLAENYLTKNAFVFGIDGWTFLDKEKEYVINGNVATSYTSGSKKAITRLQKAYYRYFQRPDATYATLDKEKTSLSGWSTRIALNKEKGNIPLNIAVGAISPNFEKNDLSSQSMAGIINWHIKTGYKWFKPDETLFRYKSISVAYRTNRNFEGKLMHSSFFITGYGELLNYYSIYAMFYQGFESYNQDFTRGGPLTKNSSGNSYEFELSSDSRNKIIFSAGTSLGRYTSSRKNSISFGITWKPNNNLRIKVSPRYSYNFNREQWIGAFDDDAAKATFGRRYVFGQLVRDNYEASIRINWTFTPRISLQAYIQPYISVGSYSKFHELAKPSTYDYNYYKNVLYNSETDKYTIKPKESEKTFSFRNRNFNYKSFKTNIVLRWEVLPGSTFYLAWTHDKQNYDDPGNIEFGRDFKNLFRAEADNVFLAKFTYWFN